MLKPDQSGRSNQKNRNKTSHLSVEPVTRLTRCRVNRFLFFFSSFDHAAPFLKKLHMFFVFYFIDFFNIINQNNQVSMLTETFNIIGAQGNFLKFVCYFILLYVFIYFKLNELFF